MEKKQQQKDIPDGIGFSGNEDEGIDNLIQEMNQTDRNTDSEDDAFDKDLGLEQEASESPEEGSRKDAEAQREGNEDNAASTSSATEDQESKEETPENKDDTTDEPFYDAKRDFPDFDGQPSKYKDRIELNEGMAAKTSYARKLIDDLQKNGSGVGAVELPDIFDGNTDFLQDGFDRGQFAGADNDSAKKAIMQMDQFIGRLKQKSDRIGQDRQKQQVSEQAQQAYSKALDDVKGALNVLDIDMDEAKNMSIEQLTGKADDLMNELSGIEGEDYVSQHGAKQFYERIKTIENAKQVIQNFPDRAQKLQSQLQPDQEDERATQQQVQQAWQEFKDDRSDLPLFQATTNEPQESFLEYVRTQMQRGQTPPPTSPRDWLKNWNSYQAMIDKERQNYQGVNEPADSKASRADRSGKTPPPPSKRDAKSVRENRLTTGDIDAEMDEMAKELNAAQ